jgi:hypothetical protein
LFTVPVYWVHKQRKNALSKQIGFLTARFLSPSNEYFENAEVYRLQYHLDGERLTVMDALGQKITYDTLAEFRHDWDTRNIPKRYQPFNPDF